MKNDAQTLIRVIVFGIIGFAIGAFIMNKCSSDANEAMPLTDSMQIKNIEINRRIIPRAHRIEKAKAEIPKAQLKAQTLYDTIIVYMPDTCKPYLSSYKAFRDSTEQLLLYVLASQDSTIRDQDNIIRNDSIMLVRAYKSVSDTVKYYKKEVRRAKWKGRLEGATLYAIIREGVNVVKQLKP